MIITEKTTIDGRIFIHTMSDENRYIVRDGVVYVDAYDPEEYHRDYTEGDLIPDEDGED